jgi:hypothetical protein
MERCAKIVQPGHTCSETSDMGGSCLPLYQRQAESSRLCTQRSDLTGVMYQLSWSPSLAQDHREKMIKAYSNAKHCPQEQQPRGSATTLVGPVPQPRASPDSDDERHTKVYVPTHRPQASVVGDFPDGGLGCSAITATSSGFRQSLQIGGCGLFGGASGQPTRLRKASHSSRASPALTGFAQ